MSSMQFGSGGMNSGEEGSGGGLKRQSTASSSFSSSSRGSGGTIGRRSRAKSGKLSKMGGTLGRSSSLATGALGLLAAQMQFGDSDAFIGE